MGAGSSPGGDVGDCGGAVTPYYASPEAFEGKLSRASDQYSLALTFCELAFGRIPFAGDDETQVAQRRQGDFEMGFIPEELRPVTARALSPDPSRRFPSCLDFIGALLLVWGKTEQGRAELLRPLQQMRPLELLAWFEGRVAPEKPPTPKKPPSATVWALGQLVQFLQNKLWIGGIAILCCIFALIFIIPVKVLGKGWGIPADLFIGLVVVITYYIYKTPKWSDNREQKKAGSWGSWLAYMLRRPFRITELTPSWQDRWVFVTVVAVLYVPELLLFAVVKLYFH